jgi:urease accessory protein
MKRVLMLTALLAVTATPVLAYTGNGSPASFAAGIAHPISGLDHMAAMIAVGLWAALKGHRALLIWPVSFVSMMLLGGLLGRMHVPVPFVEPGILTSVVAFGLPRSPDTDIKD